MRRRWPFRRVAVVLSGGGSYGAYEVGVLRVLEKLGLEPAILAGVSVGAINAVVWLAHGFDTRLRRAASGLPRRQRDPVERDRHRRGGRQVDLSVRAEDD